MLLLDVQYLESHEPGGFRLRYGRSRATGLAAAGLNPVSMKAAGGFLSVGTQMKIERPGKACAVTPCAEREGPMVILDNGEFRRVDAMEDWEKIEERVVSIWDNGEILIGFGEFLENNKSLYLPHTTGIGGCRFSGIWTSRIKSLNLPR